MTELGSASRIEIKLPEYVWVGKVSRKYPDFEFIFRSAIPIQHDDMICNNLFAIQGVNPSRCLDFIQNLPELRELKLLEQSPTELLLMVQTKGHIIIYYLLKYSLAVQFPIIIKNGITDLHIAGIHQHIDNFIEDLTRHGMDVSIKQIGKYNCSSLAAKLTARQKNVFEAARNQGYYDTPRKITLSDLAKNLSISKSTLSVILQRIHKTLLGEHSQIQL
jgi:predicted DNA binding protein